MGIASTPSWVASVSSTDGGKSKVSGRKCPRQQGAELDGESKTVHAAATLLDLTQIGVRQQEVFSQDVFRNLGWQPILRFR